MGRKRSLSKQISIPETGRSDRTARQRSFATGSNRPSAVTRGRPLSGKLKIIAAVLDAPVIERVLTHLGL